MAVFTVAHATDALAAWSDKHCASSRSRTISKT
jgi:hypothetical protein